MKWLPRKWGEHVCVVLTHDSDFDSILAATHGEKPSVVQMRVADVSPDVIESRSLLSNPADSGKNRTGLGRRRKLRRTATRMPTRRSRDPSGLQVRTLLYPPTLGADHKRSHAMAELLTNPTMATMPTAHWSVVPAAVETTAADPTAADSATMPFAMNAARPRRTYRSGIPRPNPYTMAKSTRTRASSYQY